MRLCNTKVRNACFIKKTERIKKGKVEETNKQRTTHQYGCLAMFYNSPLENSMNNQQTLLSLQQSFLDPGDKIWHGRRVYMVALLKTEKEKMHITFWQNYIAPKV